MSCHARLDIVGVLSCDRTAVAVPTHSIPERGERGAISSVGLIVFALLKFRKNGYLFHVRQVLYLRSRRRNEPL